MILPPYLYLTRRGSFGALFCWWWKGGRVSPVALDRGEQAMILKLNLPHRNIGGLSCAERYRHLSFDWGSKPIIFYPFSWPKSSEFQ